MPEKNGTGDDEDEELDELLNELELEENELEELLEDENEELELEREEELEEHELESEELQLENEEEQELELELEQTKNSISSNSHPVNSSAGSKLSISLIWPLILTSAAGDPIWLLAEAIIPLPSDKLQERVPVVIVTLIFNGLNPVFHAPWASRPNPPGPEASK